MSSLSPVMQPSLQAQTTPTFQPSHKPTFLATFRPSFAPSTQPSLKPRGTFFNNELYVYAAVSLFLIIALICICMVVRQGCLNKMCSCFCGRLSEEETRDVEIIVETEAVVDDMNYAECDLESGSMNGSVRLNTPRNSGSGREDDGGRSPKWCSSWLGPKPIRSPELSIVTAQEYQGHSNIVLGLATPIRVMETFQDLNDYNVHAGTGNRRALVSTLPTAHAPGRITAATALDSRDEVADQFISRMYGGDHDYLIETERNMTEVNDQFVRFAAAHVQAEDSPGSSGRETREERSNSTGRRGSRDVVGVEGDTAVPASGSDDMVFPEVSDDIPNAVSESEDDDRSRSMTSSIIIDDGSVTPCRSNSSSFIISNVPIGTEPELNSNFSRIPPLSPLGTASYRR